MPCGAKSTASQEESWKFDHDQIEKLYDSLAAYLKGAPIASHIIFPLHLRRRYNAEDVILLLRLIDLYSLVVLGAVIVSWIGLSPYHPVVKFFRTLTEPLLGPIRRVLPPFAGLDFSPVVLLIGLQLLRRLLFI